VCRSKGGRSKLGRKTDDDIGKFTMSIIMHRGVEKLLDKLRSVADKSSRGCPKNVTTAILVFDFELFIGDR